MKKMVTHLITGLGKGGAETMLYQVIKYNTDLDIQHKVITFGESHFYESLIKNLGVKVVEIPIKKRPISSFIRIIREIKGSEILCCWMYYANFIGYFLRRFAKAKYIIWCIRHSNLDSDKNRKLTLIINRYCAKLSRRVSLITYNGEQARHIHENIGYCKTNGIILGNGVDCEEFKPDCLARVSLCHELGITQEKRIILSVARDHPIKDIPTFLESISMLKQNYLDIVAVVCGCGLSIENQNLCHLCEEKDLEIGKDIFLLGMRNDIPRIMAGCDVYVLHSAGEAFPNTLIQAMACECLCIATDVGDCKCILGDKRWIASSRDSRGLSLTIEKALMLSAEEREIIEKNNRNNVTHNFAIRSVAREYNKIFKMIEKKEHLYESQS